MSDQRPARTPAIDTTGWPPAARQYVERLQAIIERDRTQVARGIRAVRDAIRVREWLRLGRGSYEYNDDRWRDEFGAAIDEIEAAMAQLRAVAANLNDSPTTVEAVAAARSIGMDEPDIIEEAQQAIMAASTCVCPACDRPHHRLVFTDAG